MLDERCARCTARDSETMAGMLGVCVAVCGSDEWDYELLNGVEQLYLESACRRRYEVTFGTKWCILGTVPQLTSLTSSERLRGTSAVPLPLAWDTVMVREISKCKVQLYNSVQCRMQTWVTSKLPARYGH